MERLTDLEQQVLKEINSIDGNGELITSNENYFHSQYLTILSITVPHNQLRGVLSSLVKKGYIKITDEQINYDEPEKLLTLTDKALEYYKTGH